MIRWICAVSTLVLLPVATVPGCWADVEDAESVGESAAAVKDCCCQTQSGYLCGECGTGVECKYEMTTHQTCEQVGIKCCSKKHCGYDHD